MLLCSLYAPDIIKKNGGYGALDITNESYDDMDRRLKHKKRSMSKCDFTNTNLATKGHVSCFW